MEAMCREFMQGQLWNPGDPIYDWIAEQCASYLKSGSTAPPMSSSTASSSMYPFSSSNSEQVQSQALIPTRKSPSSTLSQALIPAQRSTFSTLSDGNKFSLTNLICSRFSSEPDASELNLQSMNYCNWNSNQISNSMIRVAVTRIFADPAQSIMEIPVNSIDSYRRLRSTARGTPNHPSVNSGWGSFPFSIG